MSTAVREDLLWSFGKTGDPEIDAREERILEVLLAVRPQVKQRLVDEGRLNEARAALRRVLAARKLPLSPEQDAQIDACEDLPRLERWLEQAITAASAEDALR